jgi:hypothetical protein
MDIFTYLSQVKEQPRLSKRQKNDKLKGMLFIKNYKADGFSKLF